MFNDLNIYNNRGNWDIQKGWVCCHDQRGESKIACQTKQLQTQTTTRAPTMSDGSSSPAPGSQRSINSIRSNAVADLTRDFLGRRVQSIRASVSKGTIQSQGKKAKRLKSMSSYCSRLNTRLYFILIDAFYNHIVIMEGKYTCI